MVKNKGRKVAKRRAKRRLSTLERGIAAGLAQAGQNQYEIAGQLNCTTKTVRELLKKIDETKSLADRKRSGRPRKTSPREDRIVVRQSYLNRRLDANELSKKIVPNLVKNHISHSTVQRRLREAGLFGRVARKKPWLTLAHRFARWKWATKHQYLTWDDWKQVIFSDESPFTLFQRGGRRWVRRRAGEAYLDQCVQPTVKHGGGKIQVWGCFSWNGAGPLYRVKDKLNGAQYRQILKTHMAPFLAKYQQETGREVIFQQDNDPKHTSKVAQRYLENKSIVLLDWPSQSPDMNPIEHAWDELKDKMEQRVPKASNLNEVFEIAKEEWRNLPVQYFRDLICSMPERLKAVRKAKGGHTKY